MIVDEADVLRDEGEAYAARLRAAGIAVTTVRYDGITHDFMMLNPLSERTRRAPRSPRRSRSCATPLIWRTDKRRETLLEDDDDRYLRCHS